ncbi:Ig-like domain-containing protein, partial [Roseisolibacter sp. H3M3-2]|uniref:Ig-like domain-containing protein n=1 Tax=Roseisolibacter sp. H3M3-2 TaxID=3031323 RepID=UPI0023DCE485
MPLRRPSLRPAAPALALAALGATALAGCGGDSPTEGPTPDSATFAIVPAGGSTVVPGLEGKQFSAAPGDSLRLATQLRRNGSTSTPTAVTWRSTDAAVAEVTPDGLLRARALGSASVIAGADGLADTLRVVVSTCGIVRAVDLPVGGVQAFGAGQGTDLCIAAGTTAAEYVLIPFFAADSGIRRLNLTVTASPGAAAADAALADAGVTAGAADAAPADSPRAALGAALA